MTTLSSLRTRVRERANMENSQFVSDAEVTRYINESYATLYDLLVSRFEDYFIQDPLEFTISSGSYTYSLPSTFYKLVGVDRKSNGTDYYSIRPFSFEERNRNTNTTRLRGWNTDVKYRILGSDLRFTPEGSAPGTYRLWYIPSYTALSSDSDVIDTTITRNNWEEYIVIDAAMKCLVKEESDTNDLKIELARIEKRIEEMAQNRDIGNTDRITDVHAMGVDDPYIYR